MAPGCTCGTAAVAVAAAAVHLPSSLLTTQSGRTAAATAQVVASDKSTAAVRPAAQPTGHMHKLHGLNKF